MTGLDWLLASDPAIRWQTLRDLIGAPAEEVAAERANVATEDRPSRWNTLRAMHALRWSGSAG